LAQDLIYSVAVRNARLDVVETTVGTSPKLRIYAGSIPADADAALGGATLLAEGDLPSDWMAAASSGVKGKNGTWNLTGQSGAGAGTDATFFRVYRSNGTTCDIQGTAGESADTPDLVLDNKSIANGQAISVSAFDLTGGNA